MSESTFAWLGERIKRRDAGSVFLIAPLAAFELVFFVVPFLILVRMSLNANADPGFYQPAWTLEAYRAVLASGLYRDLVVFSFKLGVIATVVAVSLALFYAYAAYRADGLRKSLLLFSIILPLLTTLVVKTYAWRPLLAPNGVLNDVLLGVGLIGSPIQFAPGIVGTVIGQVYIVFPYAVLSIYSVLSTLDWDTVEAARDLGASRPRSFLEVVVPEALPGIAVATVVSFAWSVGAYAAPSQLGSGAQTTFAMEIESLMLTQFDYPTGAAFSLLMLAAMLVVSLGVMRLLTGSIGGVEGV
ncbi:spermidine/putrescine transport system permease protein [Halarchaeum solikamskense]|uniref:ABC transporter permease n=1 Tax=Halarchaeum nitratireducens TaxID=489913 RepID=UPI00315ABFEA|nr:spermidine/putrescine transport system permease protein [Halarchaeum solikamskense]